MRAIFASGRSRSADRNGAVRIRYKDSGLSRESHVRVAIDKLFPDTFEGRDSVRLLESGIYVVFRPEPGNQEREDEGHGIREETECSRAISRACLMDSRVNEFPN